MQKNGVSIIIPAWGAEEWINDCLESIYDQTYFQENNNWEILVGIDNCENTRNAIQPKENTKVIYFQDNFGPYIVRNALSYKIAKYDNLIFFDSDDLMNPDLIKDCFHMNKDFIVFQYLLAGQIKYSFGPSFIKKQLLFDFGGYDNWRCAADSDFIQRLEQGGRQCIKLTGKNYMYRRIHDKQLTCAKETGLRSQLRLDYRLKTNRKLKTNDLINIPQFGEFEEIIFENELLTHYEPSGNYIELIEQIKEDKLDKFITDNYIICSVSTIDNIEKINRLKHRLDLLGCKYDIKCMTNDTDIAKIYPKIILDMLLTYYIPVLYIDINFLFLNQPIFEICSSDFDVGFIERSDIKLFNTTKNSINYLNNWNNPTKIVNLKNIINI